MVKKNACIFISGAGSNLNNLISRSRDYTFPINIKLVISNNSRAKGLNYAKKNLIPYKIINTHSRDFEYKLLKDLKKYNIAIICLAGYMKILSKNFINKFDKKIINIHPSLLPKFKGLNTYFRILKEKEKKTGCTVHYVDDRLDNGKIISQKFFYIHSKDNEKNLKNKTKRLEYSVFPEAIIKLFRNN